MKGPFRCRKEPCEVFGDACFAISLKGEVEDVILVDEDTVFYEPGDGFAYDGFVDAEDVILCGPFRQDLGGRTGVAVFNKLLHSIHYSGIDPERVRFGYAEGIGDGVGLEKGDAVNVFRQLVWVLGEDLDCLVPIGVHDFL